MIMQDKKKWNEIFATGKKYTIVSEALLDDLLEGRSSGDVLDIGCGTGELTAQLSRRGYSVTGVDISDVAIDQAKEANKNVEYICSSFEDYETNKKFDVIFFNLVLPFLNKEDTIKKAESLLTENGFIVVITPYIDEKYRGKLDERQLRISLDDNEITSLGLEWFNKSYFAGYEIRAILIKVL